MSKNGHKLIFGYHHNQQKTLHRTYNRPCMIKRDIWECKSSRKIVNLAIEILEIIFFDIAWNFMSQFPTDIRKIFVERLGYYTVISDNFPINNKLRWFFLERFLPSTLFIVDHIFSRLPVLFFSFWSKFLFWASLTRRVTKFRLSLYWFS